MDFSTSQNLAAVLISDDFPLFRLGIRHAIHSAFGERQFVELDGNKDLADLEVGSGVSLLILNYSSRKPNDIAKYVELKKRNGDFKMLIIASDVSDTEIHDIFSAGVDGFLLKNCGLDEFQEAISKIETGERYFAPNVSSRLLPRKTDYQTGTRNLAVDFRGEHQSGDCRDAQHQPSYG